MSLSPISFIAPNYRDYKNEWLKAYEPGTTTPKSMALDAGGVVTVAKLQLNADGFIVTAGAAIVIPYVDSAYDLWLFPTEAEADSNDTSGAIKLADDIIGVAGTGAKIVPSTLSDAVANVGAVEGQIVQITDRGNAQFTYATGQAPDTFGIVACTGVVTLSLVVDTNNKASIKMFGAVGDGVANDTAAIQACYDHVIALGARTSVTWDSDGTYLFDQINIKSLFFVDSFAYGTQLKLNFSGGAAITMQGSEHKWYGSRVTPQSTSSAHKPRLFDITQSASYPQCAGVKIVDVTARDVYQFALAYMDDVTFPANSNFRHIFDRCVSNVTSNGQSSWVGSYGIRLDGTTHSNSAGNDTRCINCDMLNSETCFYTNGVKTTLDNCARDGQATGVELDGGTQFTSIGGYSEFHANHYKYTNSPTDPISIGTLYGGLGSFSTGTIGNGNTNGRHLSYGDIGLVLTEQFKNVNVQTSGADCYRGKTATGVSFAANITSTGDGFTIEDDGTEVGSINIVNSLMNVNATTWSTSGTFHPSADAIHNLGSATLFWNRVRAVTHVLRDGVTAPTATAGEAKLFVDVADGDLKVIFGDGTTKTIATD